MKILEKNGCRIDFASAPHERKLDKPNEDKLLVDEENRIYIILDGVTRPHAEYEACPFESSALDVGDIFLSEVYSYIKAHISDPDPKEILTEAVRLGNRRIKEYRERKSLSEWEFYPSTLGIISILRGGVLHYLCVGDCLGLLIRGSSKLLFGKQLSLEAVDLQNVTKKQRYDIYCNHEENLHSYTVFNGDEAAMEGVEYSFIDVHEGDTVFLASDGLGCYLKYEKVKDLLSRSANEIISLSGRYDLPPYSEYADDKTIIKLSF